MAVFYVYVPITEGEWHAVETALPHIKEIEADIAAHWRKDVDPAIFKI